jgi:uncharacterized protein YjiS (DUF1127 family)
MIKWIARLVRALTGRAPDRLAQARKTLKTRLSPHLMKDIGLDDP